MTDTFDWLNFDGLKKETYRFRLQKNAPLHMKRLKLNLKLDDIQPPNGTGWQNRRNSADNRTKRKKKKMVHKSMRHVEPLTVQARAQRKAYHLSNYPLVIETLESVGYQLQEWINRRRSCWSFCVFSCNGNLNDEE